MKTVNYILQAGPERTSGYAEPQDRGLPKVVDLAAWKAEHLAEPDGLETDDLPTSAPKQCGGRKPVRRRRPTALDRAELAATLAVIAAFLALAARVFLF